MGAPPNRPFPPHPDLERYYPPGHKGEFVRNTFDAAAKDYERVEKLMALGTGGWYRRRALARYGLPPSGLALDEATGTGLVARELLRLGGRKTAVVGLDPSWGMLRQALSQRPYPCVCGVGETLPFGDQRFALITMGYALRHLPDLNTVFREFYRVLAPGGKVLILEITPPPRGWGRALLKAYIRGITPALAWVLTGRRRTSILWQYFWDTMAACCPPEQVLAALEGCGFAKVQRFVELGIFSEYTAVRPPEPESPLQA